MTTLSVSEDQRLPELLMIEANLLLNLRDAGHEIVLKTFGLVSLMHKTGKDQSVVFHPEGPAWKKVPCDIAVDVLSTEEGWTAPIRLLSKGSGPIAICDLSGRGKDSTFRPESLDLHFVDDDRREKEMEAGGSPLPHLVAKTLELTVGMAFRDCLLAYYLDRLPFSARQDHYDDLAGIWSADAGHVIGVAAARAMAQVIQGEPVRLPPDELTVIDTMSGNALQAMLTVGTHKPTKQNLETNPSAIISFSLTISYGDIVKQENLLHRCMGELIVGMVKEGGRVNVVIAVEQDGSDNPLRRPELEEPLIREVVRVVEKVMMASPLVE